MSKAAVLIEKRLGEYKAKPLLPLELTEITRKLKDPQTSLESFKPYFSRDPVLCWSLISAANLATKNRASQPYAADHALSTIGLAQAKKLFKGLNPKIAAPNDLPIEVRFSLAASLLAAEIARQIGDLHHASNQIYWTALCYRMPETLLWYLQPKSMWRIYYRQLTLPKRITLYEESKLGFNLQDWRKAVAREFHLSEQNQRLAEIPVPSNPKELFTYARYGISDKTPSISKWHKQEGWHVVLANRLAMAILVPWQNSSFRHLVQLIYQDAYCDSKKLNKAINEAICTVSLQLQGSQLPIPAVSHLLINSRPQFPQWLVSPSIQLANKRNAEKTRSSLSGIIRQLEQEANTFESSTMLVYHGLKTLLNDLAFSRVTFLAVDYEKNKVLTKIALNQPGAEKIRPDFDFQQSTPLQNFIDKQAFMHFSRDKHQAVWRKLPLAIQKAKVEQFILCSLKPGKRVRAIIYADAQDDNAFSPQSLMVVKKLLKAINKGLMSRNEAKRGNGLKSQVLKQ